MRKSSLYPAPPSQPPASNAPLTLLGGMSPAQFMRRYWQKKPLLIRGAVPAMAQDCPISREALFSLADDEDVESRLITQQRQAWQLAHGPFAAEDLPSLKRKAWTLLVQGVNLHHSAAHELMQQFRFIPDARLDDVMISYATDGGGVGPHFDSYDVFLLQAHGKRRWRISAQKDLALQAGVPLKILENFAPEQEWLLEPGDMLYLPPHYAHDGIAEGECMTWSVGFRSPRWANLRSDFLHWLADDLLEAEDPQQARPACYADPKQAPSSTPAELPAALVEGLAARLAKLRWQDEDLQRFLGCHLTEPKPQVFFTPPAKRLSPKAWEKRLQQQGIRLAARSQALYAADLFFINGEEFACSGIERRLLQKLANQHFLGAEDAQKVIQSAVLNSTLLDWYEAGWVE